MVVVSSGNNWKGEPCEYHLDDNLEKNLRSVKGVVGDKDFDIVVLVSGLPGLGKSNFAINCAKYCDPNFTEKNIAFTAEEFIELTNTCKKHSAVILDESFASLNSKISLSSDFLRIINHLQLIRQRNLYIFLCLPNFFDLNKSIAIYRSSFLFVCYGEEFGKRGSFAAFGREEKKMLYILGQKYMNYQAVKPNFRGKFVKQKAIDENLYMDLKLQHLQEQNKKAEKKSKSSAQRDRFVNFLLNELKIPAKRLAEIGDMPVVTIYQCANRGKNEPTR